MNTLAYEVVRLSLVILWEINMAEGPTTIPHGGDDDDSEWEYEYHETETEVDHTLLI